MKPEIYYHHAGPVGGGSLKGPDRTGKKIPEVLPLHLLAEQLIDEFASQNMKLTLVEGPTSGDIAQRITVRKSTSVFGLSFIAQSAQAKERLGVPKPTIKEFGPHSPEVTKALIDAVQPIRKYDVVIVTTGNLEKGTPIRIACSVPTDGSNSEPEMVTIDTPPGSLGKQKDIITHVALQLAFNKVRRKNDTVHVPSGSDVATDENPHLEVIRQVTNYIRQRGHTITFVESCTGGALVNAFTDVPAAGDLLVQGMVAYDEFSKGWLRIDPLSLGDGGAYTHATAKKMAKAGRLWSSADISVSATGLLDTTDTRFNDIPPGNVFVGMKIDGMETKSYQFTLNITNRADMKMQTVGKVFHELASLLKPHVPLTLE